LRVPAAWVIAAAFALQSMLFYGFNAWLADAYVERGWGETAAGGLVAAMNGVALVVGVWTALVGDRFGSRRAFLVTSSAAAVAAGTLLAADVGGAWLWSALLGAAMGVLFTIIMTLPLDVAQGRAEIAAYTTVMLGIGYTVSALAPVTLGAIRDATGTFTVPLTLLAVDAVLLLAVSAVATARSGAPAPAGTRP
jgi:CP family cyanate transporter-like MFS transporter